MSEFFGPARPVEDLLVHPDETTALDPFEQTPVLDGPAAARPSGL